MNSTTEFSATNGLPNRQISFKQHGEDRIKFFRQLLPVQRGGMLNENRIGHNRSFVVKIAIG